MKQYTKGEIGKITRAFAKAGVVETQRLNVTNVVAHFKLLEIPMDDTRSSSRLSEWIKVTDELMRLTDEEYLASIANKDPKGLTKREAYILRGHKAGLASGQSRKVAA